MDALLAKVKWQFVWLYLDDMVISSRVLDERIEHVCQVLTLLNDTGVMLSLKKYEFFTNRISYLGHGVRPIVSRC